MTLSTWHLSLSFQLITNCCLGRFTFALITKTFNTIDETTLLIDEITIIIDE